MFTIVSVHIEKMKIRIKNENKQNIDVLLSKIKDIANIDENGRLIYHSFEYDDIQWIFLSIIDFGNILNVESQKTILTRTIAEVIKNQRFDKSFFIKQLNTEIENYNNKKEQTYFLLISLSIEKLPFRKIKLGDSTITIHRKRFPKNFEKERNNLLKSNHFSDDIAVYTKVSIQVKSKDYRDAYTKGFYYIEILRSFLCLLLNHGFEMRFGERSRKPINRILRGETSTLHFSDGKVVNNHFIYFTLDYKESKILQLEPEKVKSLKSSINWLTKAFNNCNPKHQHKIGQTLNCYVDAFDEYSFDISFLKVWTALEKITNSDQNDDVIRRCLALFPQNSKSFEKQKLEALRLFRNEFIHEGDRGLDSFHACFGVQDFLYILIIKFNLAYSGFFENIEEANLYLDNYVTDLNELKKRKKIIDKVLIKKQKNTKR